MGWTIEYDKAVGKDLKRLDTATAKRILDYMDMTVAELEHPRLRGKALRHDLKGLWRYRVGDYRVLCRLEDAQQVVFVLQIEHRRSAYG